MTSPASKPYSLLIRDIHTLVLMDEQDTVLRGAFLYAENGEIKLVGTRPPSGLRPTRTMSGRHLVGIPGMVNTHHHFYQTLTRAYPGAADASLFEWLRALYPLWARLDEEALYVAALVGMAELMLSGCTTTADHHYIFPRGQTKMIDAEIEAARRIGIRFHPTRGSMSVGRTRGGLPPDSLVQNEETILADSERLIGKYHDPRPASMLQIGLAPCSPFSVSKELMLQTAELGYRHGVRLHTHLAETRDEVIYCQKRFHQRPLAFLEQMKWLGDSTWIAHGIHFGPSEIVRLGRARVGVAHCPSSNMRLASGVAPVLDLARAGCPVGLGVDGSASNDSSHLLAEVRQALLLQRLAHGAGALSVRQALRMATVESARCLGRCDLGSLEPHKRADVALFDLRDSSYSGAGDAVAALVLCAPTRVSTLVIEGRVVVENHELQTLAMASILARHRRIAAKIIGSPPLF
ncbi:MAG TPA: 8-oxoguanine deaminase [Candidatus Eremiobacteraceae bacterium]|nr:8-oxoguanine deaminase [Candidatus Eremiobacteraceae bacterium]